MNKGRKAAKPAPRDIAARLSAVREQAGKTQVQFATRWGMSARTYQSYERAESWLSCELLVQLAAAGVDIPWLLTGAASQQQPAAIQPPLPSLVDLFERADERELKEFVGHLVIKHARGQ